MKLRLRQNWFKISVLALLLCLLFYCKRCTSGSQEPCKESASDSIKNLPKQSEVVHKQNKLKENGKEIVDYEHKLCILVPFRDRFEELLEFAPHMNRFLGKQNIVHELWIIHQKDNYRFNRAYLLNVGFKESSKSCDYIAMQDVDLLPINPRLEYKYTEDSVYHPAAPGLHPKYDYETFLGGVLLMPRKIYQHVDGMSNKYWGWGLEDDEFFVRLRQANVRVERPGRIGSGKSNTFKDIHNNRKRSRDQSKCYNQRNLTRRRDRDTGLSTVDYTVAGSHNLNINGAEVHFIDVMLICDTNMTPWCNCTGAPKDTEPLDKTRDEDVVVPVVKRNNNKHAQKNFL